jgi:uncharacterized protein YkwD
VACYRNPLLACICALGLAACLPAAAALAAGHRRASGPHRAAHRISHAQRARCGAGGRSHRRGHARRASFRSGARPRHAGAVRCHRGAARHLHRVVHAPRRHHAPRHRRTAARSSACVDADLTPTQWNLERVRAATLCLVNRERAGQGENALNPDARLAHAAQSHTEEMVWGDYFEHVGKHGDTPLSRMRASGYINSSRVGYEVGENIGWGTLWLATPRAIVSAWMGSPEHRANILNGRYRDTAIGVSPHPLASMARGQAGATYTQDFGVILTG